MEIPPDSSLILGLTEEGEPQRLSEVSEDYVSYVGFDPERNRLVEIHRLGSEQELGLQKNRSLEERLALAGRLSHPILSQVLESGKDPSGHHYFATEFVEGESLFEYLERVRKFPRNLGIHLVFQMAEVAGFLADYPRLLATIMLDDFAVSLERGRFLALRLCHLGLDRDDNPVSDAILGAHWIEMVGRLLQHFLAGAPLPSRIDLPGASGKEPEPGVARSPVTALIEGLRSQPGSVAIRELKRLRTTLFQAAGFGAPGPDEVANLGPSFRAVTCPEQVPRGPLRMLFQDSSEFEEITQNRWLIQSNLSSADGGSPFSFATRTHRNPAGNLTDRGEGYDLLMLPPERLVGGYQLPVLNRQMGNSFLKNHPYLVRTRTVVCDGDFTLVASEPACGFSLMEWISRRGRVPAREALVLTEEMVRMMAHLQGAGLDLDRLDPRRLIIHFEDQPPPERLEEFASAVPSLEWTRMVVKLRPLAPTESLVESEGGTWRYLSRRLNRKSLPALFAWMTECDRFDRWLAEGCAGEKPLCSSSPAIAQLLEKAGVFLDSSDPHQRQRFLELLRHAIGNQPINAEVTQDAGRKPEFKKRRWGLGRRKSLSAV